MNNFLSSLILLLLGIGGLTAQNVSSAEHIHAFSILYQETNAEGVVFDNTGTKMFVLGRTGNISEYALSTPFEVSTAAYIRRVNIASEDSFATDIRFNANGTKLYMIGRTKDNVNEYNLSTAFDISSLSYRTSFNVRAQETTPQGLAFNAAGTKLFVVGLTGDDINEYTLSSAFDISTASYKQNLSIAAQEASPTSLIFNTEGNILYVLGFTGDNIYQYQLSTPYDISTASYTEEKSIRSNENRPTGIYLNNNGQLYLVGKGNYAVNQFQLPTNNADPDNDGDNVPFSQDCNDNDPNLTTTGASCDDGNPNTSDDKVTTNCSCEGTINDPDNDGDNVPFSQDCNDNDPNLTTTGASCDDGNPNTSDDKVTANCSCEGTPTGGSNSSLWTDQTSHISTNQKVLIGATSNLPDGYNLFVEEGILAKKMKLALPNTSAWADYVFEENYDLRPIKEVEDFVKKNKHLPNVPSAEELGKGGIDIVTMNATLLRQIEELWLHVIELKKENEELKELVLKEKN